MQSVRQLRLALLLASAFARRLRLLHPSGGFRALSGERPRVERSGRLLALVALDLFLDLSFYGLEVEARRRLHRRKFDGCSRQSADLFLNNDEPPEFAAHEIVHVASAGVVQAFSAGYRRSLKRILADIDDGWHVGGVLFARPPVRLLEELKLEVIVAKGTKMGTGKIEDLVASGRALARQNIHLVVTIEMVLVGAAFQCHALEKLVGNVWVSGSSG